ncbi:30S ribosomal protein S1, chloroplastic [Glycine max]|nr:30S ribosomal protein S1, chloroplastic [Glycine max]
MPFTLHPSKSLCSPNFTITPGKDTTLFTNTFFFINKPRKNPTKFRSFAKVVLYTPRASIVSKKDPILGYTHFTLRSRSDGFDGFSTDVSQDDGTSQELEQLELLNKPSPVLVTEESSSEVEVEEEKPSKEEALAPFLKFFKGKDSGQEVEEDGEGLEVSEEKSDVEGENEEGDKKVSVEYYEPKPGDFVVGVVVSGNENKLDVNVGADLLGTMLTKEVLPLYGKEMENLLCDVDKDAEDFMVNGKMGIVKNEEAISGVPVPGRPVLEIGTILFAEVLGRTLSGRPLLSTRRLFRRIAWHRVRQIKQLNEPIEVRITEWNTGGLLTRIEGLRAFLPKAELVKRANSFTELKENQKLYLREGTLLDGTVKKILPYGAQIKLGKTNRSGLLHVSNISRAEVTSVSNILSVDENVKALVVKSMFPDKISLSIADLESEPGLFLSNKERVYMEADMMAKKYKQKLPPSVTTQRLEPLPTSALPFENEALYSNWKWFKFEK